MWLCTVNDLHIFTHIHSLSYTSITYTYAQKLQRSSINRTLKVICVTGCDDAFKKTKQRSGIRELHFTQKVITLGFKNKKREVVRFLADWWGHMVPAGPVFDPSSFCVAPSHQLDELWDPIFSTHHANSSLRSFGLIAGWAGPHLKKPPTLERGNGGRLAFIF